MEGACLEIRKAHVVRIDPGEDLLKTVKQYLAESGLTQAVVLGGYGTLASQNLRWVGNNVLPVENVYGLADEGIEILAMNGMIVGGDPHIHIVLSTPRGACGGHLEEGCIVYLLCEVILGELEGMALEKRTAEVNDPLVGRGSVPRLTFMKK